MPNRSTDSRDDVTYVANETKQSAIVEPQRVHGVHRVIARISIRLASFIDVWVDREELCGGLVEIAMHQINKACWIGITTGEAKRRRHTAVTARYAKTRIVHRSNDASARVELIPNSRCVRDKIAGRGSVNR